MSNIFLSINNHDFIFENIPDLEYIRCVQRTDDYYYVTLIFSDKAQATFYLESKLNDDPIYLKQFIEDVRKWRSANKSFDWITA